MPSKTKTKPAKIKSPASKRKLTQPNYQTFRLSKRIRQPKPPLPGSARLFLRSLKKLWQNKRLFGGMLLVYALLSLLFVKTYNESAQPDETALAVARTYQIILFILMSLAVIWGLRKTSSSKQQLRLRDSFYKSTHPLVSFILVLLVICLQLIPILIANFLYAQIFNSGIAATPIEQGLWALLFACMVTLSLYMVSSSIFSLYIVTLPDVSPMQALRSARDLVKFRRWAIVRKLVFLIMSGLILSAVILIPMIIFVPVIAEWLSFALSLVALFVVHSYLYNLYRELL